MKTRMRADLRAAMKEGRAAEAKVIRALVAAIDNAEAPALHAGDSRTADPHRFGEGTAEIERLWLGQDDVRAILIADIREREAAADEMTRLGQGERAEALPAEAAVAKRYIG